MGLLEILFEVFSPSDVSFREPGIVKDSCLLFKGGNCLFFKGLESRWYQVYVFYFYLPTVFSEIVVFSILNTFLTLQSKNPSRHEQLIYMCVYDLFSSV